MSGLANIPTPKLSIEKMLEEAIKIRDSLQTYYTGDRVSEVDARNAAIDLADGLEDMKVDWETFDERDRSEFERNQQMEDKTK